MLIGLCQPTGNLLENIGVATRCVVEPGGIYEVDICAVIEIAAFVNPYFNCAYGIRVRLPS